MKAIVYSYQNHKPIFFELDRYYFLRSKKQYEALIDRLLDIDAVSVPFFPEDVIQFPLLLELKSGFAPTLVVTSTRALKKELNSLKSLRKQMKRGKNK